MDIWQGGSLDTYCRGTIGFACGSPSAPQYKAGIFGGRAPVAKHARHPLQDKSAASHHIPETVSTRRPVSATSSDQNATNLSKAVSDKGQGTYASFAVNHALGVPAGSSLPAYLSMYHSSALSTVVVGCGFRLSNSTLRSTFADFAQLVLVITVHK